MKQLLWPSAIIAGFLLALMIHTNGALAHLTTPIWASFVAHFVGFVFSTILLSFYFKAEFRDKSAIPKWAYLGGIPGALIVILASITINSPIGLTGTLALMLLGQIIMSLLVDLTGLFAMPKRKLNFFDFFSVVSTMTGAAMIIFFAGV